ncbi:MAG: four helix bundle protein [Ignavibacteriae bacterium]|nr:four helix bundle protein [Ignavibacteriota bacterium]
MTETVDRKLLKSHFELEVYQLAFELAMKIFELSKKFPVEEKYSLTDQIRRASRSVCTNIAEAWRKRRYEAAFVSRLSDAEAESAETQTWIQFGVRCGYIDKQEGEILYRNYDDVIGKIVTMINNPSPWILRKNHC